MTAPPKIYNDVEINNARVQFSEAHIVVGQWSEMLMGLFSAQANVQIMSHLKDEWVRLVRGSTWFHPVPASETAIIKEIRSAGTTSFLTVGWYSYKGSLAASQKRINLRMYGYAGHEGFASIAERVIRNWVR